MKWVHTLVDYDNATERPERVLSDTMVNLTVLVNRLTRKVSSIVPDSEELLVRLYGGWITLGNQLTHRANWLLAALPNFRKKFGPLRVRITIAREIVARSDLTLIGTYQNSEQKMVDGMLSVDLLELSPQRDTSLVLVSDDDDFVPAVVASAERRTAANPVHILRRRKPVGSAGNDLLLKGCNVRIAEY